MSKRISGRRWPLGLVLCAALALGGCGPMDKGLDEALDSDAGMTTEDVQTQIKAILRALFPDLTEEEIDDLAASIDLDAVIALKAELDAVRKEAEKFSAELFTTAGERVDQRTKDLEPENGGFPTSLQAVGSGLFLSSAGQATLELSGVFSGQEAIALGSGQASLKIDGQDTPVTLDCLQDGTPADIVFLVDVTGSMNSVIDSVRNSLVKFVDAITKSKISGTLSVVTFQDTVGVNVSFQQPSPGVERSPFFTPIPIDDDQGVANLQRFITRLEANMGADLPENLAAAIDFARNNVIGYAGGKPNVIGDGIGDPAHVSPFPKLKNPRQVFVVFTDATFHSDGATSKNSSLLDAFKPRKLDEIVSSLRKTGTVVHVSDPSWVDKNVEPGSTTAEADSDYWAIQTGGLGEDRILGYSLTDLELVIVANDTGLLDIALNGILSSSCSADIDEPSLIASSQVSLELDTGTETVSQPLTVVSY